MTNDIEVYGESHVDFNKPYKLGQGKQLVGGILMIFKIHHYNKLSHTILRALQNTNQNVQVEQSFTRISLLCQPIKYPKKIIKKFYQKQHE